jgi:hypothetical protein
MPDRVMRLVEFGRLPGTEPARPDQQHEGIGLGDLLRERGQLGGIDLVVQQIETLAPANGSA